MYTVCPGAAWPAMDSTGKETVSYMVYTSMHIKATVDLACISRIYEFPQIWEGGGESNNFLHMYKSISMI